MAVIAGILAVSFAITPLALASLPSYSAASSGYPFELLGRVEYVAPHGTPNPFGSVVHTFAFYNSPAVSAAPFAWVPVSTYSTSPGHGL